jgi:hypothetical protein
MMVEMDHTEMRGRLTSSRGFGCAEKKENTRHREGAETRGEFVSSKRKRC